MSRAVREKTNEKRERARPMAPCGLVARAECEAGLAALLEGCRADRVALRRVGRRHCGVFQCVEERGLAYCGQCPEFACAFHTKLARICPIEAGSHALEPSAWKLVALGPGPLARPAENGITGVPGRTVSRTRWYVAALERFREAGVKVVSSAEIAAKVGVKPALVRRDLCCFGQFGTPSVGYDLGALLGRLQAVFAVERPRRVVWVGAERLRQDAGLLERFAHHNWPVVAVFDPEADQQGKVVGGMVVRELAQLGAAVRQLGAGTAVLAVGEAEVQAVADRLVEAGVEAILNLAPTPISAPAGVAVQQADLTTQLMLLSYQASLHGASRDV